ncbi:MAG: histidinol dehydrogenase [Acidobacteria bacterium]|nr:histidinol dehydrogenase [Acidobacteriota bacterium]
MKVISPTNVRARRRLLERGQAADPAVAEQAARIVDDVRARGDSALREYARRFDKLRGSLEVTEQEIRDNAAEAPSAVRRAIAQAARHIRRIAKRQVPREWRAATVPGVVVEQRVTPLARVGCYVPGGRYPLPSSLLMTAVPARVAGVNEVIAVCPRPDPSVCAAALEAGIARLFRIGGAHAVAALAYGTRTVPRVDKIVGPGNAYVAAAKAHVAADCPIDFFAGPTEIVIVAAGGNASWIAADLVAQAEHDPDARALLLTPNAELARAVARAVDSQLEHHPAARQSIEQHGGAIVTNDLGEAVDLANAIAPEHAVCDDEFTARALTRAGTVFVGPYGAQAAGDYATGSNHVLPTGGAARFRGGLSAADFVRVSSVQHLSGDGLRRLAPTAISLANAEGLVAHAASIAVRLR